MARGAWDQTAALMYAIASASFGGVKRGLSPNHLNPYRKGQKASLKDWFAGMRARKAEQDRRAAEAAKLAQANGEPNGG